MGKAKKIIIGIIIFIIAIAILLVGVYFAEFKPTVATTPINSQVQINEGKLIEKFIPTNVNLSLKGISAESDVKISFEELTNLAAYTISKDANIEKFIKGIKITTENNNLVVYVTVEKFGIPVQAKAVFSVLAQNGDGILHFDSANVGFISIPKNAIFNGLTDNEFVQFNEQSGDIILHPANLNNIEITGLSIQDTNLDMKVKGSINFF